jgi:squalene synthase HpnC
VTPVPPPVRDAPAPSAAPPWHGVDHPENFPVASWLVPARLRPAVVAIYRFARLADDLADEGDADVTTREADLLALADALRTAAAGRPTGQPIVDALAPLMAVHRLDWRHLHDLLDAFRQDLRVNRYQDAGGIQAYCDRSANPVGRLMLELFGAADEVNRMDSDAICSALQRINFLQDLAIDCARNRVYLPLRTLTDVGLDAAALIAQCVTIEPAAPAARSPAAPSPAAPIETPASAAAFAGPAPDRRRARHAVAAAVAIEADRARGQLLSGAGLVGRVPARLGLELRFIVAGGLRILERLALHRFDPDAPRPVLGWRDAPALLRLAFRPGSAPLGRPRLWQGGHEARPTCATSQPAGRR